MRAALVVAGGWLLSVAGAYVAGRETAASDHGSDVGAPEAGGAGGVGSSEEVSARPGSARASSGSPALTAAPGAGRAGPARAGGGEGSRLRRPEVVLVSAEEPLDLDGATTIEELMSRLLAFAAAHLSGGPAEHKELYKELVKLMDREGKFHALLSSEEQALPLAYPTLRFVFDRDAQVVDMMETLLLTGAEQPAFFEGEERDDVLEMFVEGLGPLLPGAIGPERLERLRGYAKGILGQPEASQPKALRGIRSDLERVLAYWMPPLSSAEAVARIKQGDVKGRELLSLLRRVDPKDRAQLDVAALLGVLLEEGDTPAMQELGGMDLQASDIAALDERLFDGVVKQRVSDWQMARWLTVTKRGGWPAAQAFVERGMRRGLPVSDAAALLLRQLSPQPRPADVEQLLRSYTVSERIAGSVRAQFSLK